MDGCVISSLKPKYSIKTSLRSLDLFLWLAKAYKSRRYVQTVNTLIVSSNKRALFNLKSVVLLIGLYSLHQSSSELDGLNFKL